MALRGRGYTDGPPVFSNRQERRSRALYNRVTRRQKAGERAVGGGGEMTHDGRTPSSVFRRPQVLSRVRCFGDEPRLFVSNFPPLVLLSPLARAERYFTSLLAETAKPSLLASFHGYLKTIARCCFKNKKHDPPNVRTACDSFLVARAAIRTVWFLPSFLQRIPTLSLRTITEVSKRSGILRWN